MSFIIIERQMDRMVFPTLIPMPQLDTILSLELPMTRIFHSQCFKSTNSITKVCPSVSSCSLGPSVESIHHRSSNLNAFPSHAINRP